MSTAYVSLVFVNLVWFCSAVLITRTALREVTARDRTISDLRGLVDTLRASEKRTAL